MKPWLLNVLACPIDKHHPLEAYFFTWETTNEELDKINRDAGKPERVFSKQYKHLVKQILDKTISPLSMAAIIDKSDNLITMQILSDVQKFCKILGSVELDKKKLLKEYRVFLDILYKYSNLFEVEEGLLHCPECGRWYPIGSAVETIPELMPDDLREKERDLNWLKKWKTLVPKKILEDGKPYTV
jgi:uncharacterized protein YbaR (Trm112 family)